MNYAKTVIADVIIPSVREVCDRTDGNAVRVRFAAAIPDSEGKAQIKSFQGRRVIVDDGMPVRNGTTDGLVYTTYLFGPGAFARGVAPLTTPVQGGHGTEGVEWGA